MTHEVQAEKSKQHTWGEDASNIQTVDYMSMMSMMNVNRNNLTQNNILGNGSVREILKLGKIYMKTKYFKF